MADEEERLAYRYLTGKDNREFCERVSAALEDGYVLYGHPALAFNGEHMVAGQAVVLPEVVDDMDVEIDLDGLDLEALLGDDSK